MCFCRFIKSLETSVLPPAGATGRTEQHRMTCSELHPNSETFLHTNGSKSFPEAYGGFK